MELSELRIIDQLDVNTEVYRALLHMPDPAFITWRPAPGKWCLQEIVRHLLDEEREDFRARVKHVLERPKEPLVPIDPQGWVSSRNYMGADYDTTVNGFLEERRNSITWLRELKDPAWSNFHEHPKLGPMSARLFLANWLAHDLLHFRQIMRQKYLYLQEHATVDLQYAGTW